MKSTQTQQHLTLAKLPIYVIGLKDPEHQPRRDAMQKQMAALGLKFEFVDATDGRHPLSAAEIDLMGGAKMLRRYEGDDNLTGGVVGCTISHLRCYKKLLASTHPCAVILEDDAEFTDDFISVLNALLKTPEKWNQIRLGHAKSHPYQDVMPLFGKDTFPLNLFLRRRLKPEQQTAKSAYYWGVAATVLDLTHAYLISREGCEFALKHYPAIWPMPLDDLMSYYPMPYQFVVSPAIAAQNTLTQSAVANWGYGKQHEKNRQRNKEFILMEAGQGGTTQTAAKPKSDSGTPPTQQPKNKIKSAVKFLLKLLLTSSQMKTLAEKNTLVRLSFTYALLFGRATYNKRIAASLDYHHEQMRKTQARD